MISTLGGTAPLGAVAACLFGSGLAALVYQVGWLRELRLVFGASTAASAAVLAVFMGGLGVGGLLLGRRAAASRRPLVLYAHLELAVAALAAASPLFVDGARWIYVALGGQEALGAVGSTLARLVLAAIVLGPPTILMGGTLPAAAEAVERDGDAGRRRLAVLYGVNTMGAVAGAVLATFVLLEVLGIRRMLWVAALVNALVAVVARTLGRRAGEREPQAAPSEVADGEGARPSVKPRLVLAAAALVGFAFLLMELVWYRMLAPLLGGSSYTFGLILAVALAGIGAGGAAYAAGGERRAPTATGFALTCAAEALFIALPFALGDRLAMFAALLRPVGSLGFGAEVFVWAAVTTIVVFPAAFVSGVQFPLLIALLGGGRSEVGRHVGLAYAWNTAGSIVGSLAGGFGLLPLLGAPGAWRLVVALLSLLGIATLALSPTWRSRRVLVPLACAVLALAALTARGPTAPWRHGAIGAGRGPHSGTPNALRAWRESLRASIVWEREGLESSVALDAEVGLAFVVNGKIDGNARFDAPTQVMSGLLGALLHPAPKRAMVVGLGTGSTAGWLGAVPSIERVDVAELEPAILDVARASAPVNQDALANPKLHVTLGDAREQLLTTRARYDIIFSEPSNPYRAGISSLFTSDFYRAIDARLADGGIFLQWVQAYSVDAQTVRTVYATLAAVFPHIETFVTQEADLLLVATRAPLSVDVAQLKARIAEEPYKTALRQVWRVDDVEGLLAHHAAGPGLARAIAKAEGDAISTDDLTVVEFGFARGAGRKDTLFKTDELRAIAAARGDDKPPVAPGSIDLERLADRRASMFVAQEQQPRLTPAMGAERAARVRAMQAWLAGELAAARAAWRSQPRAPEDPMELIVVGEALADGGDDAALAPILATLRAAAPPEADAIEARAALRRGAIADATALLERLFTTVRRDPWPPPILVKRALGLAIEVARRDRAAGARLEAAVREPFAVRLLDADRARTRVDLALAADAPRLCGAAFAALEPHPPWRRDILSERLRCYAATGSPLAARARRDLEEFLAAEPPLFAEGLR
jgi:predicted membrane-bound spermidine synthase